ncbi:MAG: hypothetical protein R3F33_13085 [Planctomycetota bacterium]
MKSSQWAPVRQSSRVALVFGLPLVGLVGCTTSDDTNTPFTTKTLQSSVAPNAVLAVSDRYLAFPASELGFGASGTDLNADGDLSDDVVSVLTLGNDDLVPLGVALNSASNAKGLVWCNDVLFMVVSESGDGHDWNADSDMTDKVLLTWTPGSLSATFYAEMSGNDVAVVGNEVIFEGTSNPTATLDTNLFKAAVATTGAAPAAPVRLTTSFADAATNGMEFDLGGASNGVLTLFADETVEGEDLNGDGNANDASVLALYGNGSGGQIQVVPASVDDGGPWIAFYSGTDSIVAFLVEEATQEANLNDPADFSGLWHPAQCVGLDDADQLDSVLHWLNLTDFTTDPILNPMVNTGMTSDGGIYHLADQWLGVVCHEQDEGSSGGCDLNGDGDKSDQILRWVDLSATPVPMGDANKLIAIDTAVAGGTEGVIELGGDLWVALVDEAADGRDHNGDSLMTKTFLGVLDPNLTGTTWNFDQGSGAYIDVSWMAQDRTSTSRFLAAITEASSATDRNSDGDLTDSVPTFPREGGAPRELDFPGTGVAVVPDNPGMIVSGNYGYYRISESGQNFDYNLDGDIGDTILSRVNLLGAEPATSMGSLVNNNRTAVLVGTGSNPRGIVWMTSETSEGPAGTDLNNDGDAADIVVRYARLP